MTSRLDECGCISLTRALDKTKSRLELTENVLELIEDGTQDGENKRHDG
jgi:hypothetical protein